MLFLFLGGRRRLLADPKRLGRWGERRSERFLRRRGFAVVTRNFACRSGEIDLIMSDSDGTIVFVEVKTRRDEEYSEAQEAVTLRKRTRMIRAAKHFVESYKIKNRPVRFDVVAVVLGQKGPAEIRHYPNAFVP